MNNFLKDLPKVYKAVAAFCSLLVPVVVSISTALSDGTVTTSEQIMIGASALTLIGGTVSVYQVPNKK